jgi:hypothetical protein
LETKPVLFSIQKWRGFVSRINLILVQVMTNKNRRSKKRRMASSGMSSNEESSVEMVNQSPSPDPSPSPIPSQSDKLPNFTEASTENAFWEYMKQNSKMLLCVVKKSSEWKELEEKTKKLEERTTELEGRSKEQFEVMAALQEENKELRERLAITEGYATRTQLAVEKLEERMNDSVSRSMRDNVLLRNMMEEENEDDDKIEQKVMNFFEKGMKIRKEDMGKIVIERGHRVGKKPKDNERSRDIVVKLNSKGKSIVMRNIKNLNETTSVKVLEQFPPEIHANRNKLWPTFVAAKQDGRKARWTQDKLHIDGRLIKPPSDRNKDINIDTTEVAMSLKVKHTTIVSRDNSHFQGHSVKIASVDDVTPALKALCADTRVAGASHLMYAYRVGTERYFMHNWEDDGEWGAARWIMDTIQKKNAYGQLVCVTKWCSGQHVGRARMDTIKEVADLALSGLDASGKDIGQASMDTAEEVADQA